MIQTVKISDAEYHAQEKREAIRQKYQQVISEIASQIWKRHGHPEPK